MPKSKRRRYSDFSYQHHTIRNGSVLYGGVEAGWRDDGAQALLAAYASKTTGTHRARDANVTDRVAFRTWTTGDLVVYKPWYCPGPGRLGFYNNWFVTKISWWLEDHRVAAGA